MFIQYVLNCSISRIYIRQFNCKKRQHLYVNWAILKNSASNDLSSCSRSFIFIYQNIVFVFLSFFMARQKFLLTFWSFEAVKSNNSFCDIRTPPPRHFFVETTSLIKVVLMHYQRIQRNRGRILYCDLVTTCHCWQFYTWEFQMVINQ